MSSLVVIFGRNRGDHFDIPRGSKLVVGRSTLLSHRLNDPSISREHLEFVHDADKNTCHVVDLGSRNGARINQKRLAHTRELDDGDIIQLGYSLLVYVRITFDANTPVRDFLNDCDRLYAGHLQRMRDHAAIHSDRDPGAESAGSMSGTLHLGNMFGKK